MDRPLKLLPGQALSSGGRPRLDYAVIAKLAFPFMLNSAVQAVLNATDTWFIGRLSPAATAAIGAVYWPVLVFVLLFGGVGLAVQTVVAQAYGGRRFTRAAQATWTAVWASLATLPLFAALALAGAWIFSPFGIAADTLRLALEYWFPRMLGAPLGIALWSMLGFFNGVGRPMVTLKITVVVAVANAILNQLFVFDLSLGVAGSAWATGVAQLLGVALAVSAFLSKANRVRFRSHLTARLRWRRAAGPTQVGVSHGGAVRRGHHGLRAVPADAGALGRRRRRVDADRDDADVLLLHAGDRHRDGGHHPGRPSHRGSNHSIGRPKWATGSPPSLCSTWA